MKFTRVIFTVPAVVLALSVQALGHELWIEPENYQVEPGAPLSAQIKNGEGFQGINQAWFDRRIDRVEQLQNGNLAPVTGRAGDIPALHLPDAGDGLLVLAYQSTAQTLTYRDWATFTDFVEHKALAGTLQRHAARDLPETGFKEAYSRHAKALVAVGDGRGSDRDLGLKTEFVALENPYSDDMADGLTVRLLYQGAPRDNAQVEVFARAPDGAVTITTTRTDENGQAVISVAPGHDYLLDAVVMREPAPALAEETGVVWESLWAALTFRVPG
ncbi:DUF4198 domain-containing protein [Lutimaribacter sp. EGI FJ00015]|uniref:DUF4198 domain-containing protein n=1 Tax=Lutimaribacter degradans TaxID=2945989 RepID=A0ACC5ZS97_9RHOB|nr:DUF4198 domain-containing protein [Lutimaribacter sp. EGI FJ00013]MCM2561188.1 DUF4198 domain-containing protein [Lutimaribacter sp. EGI FJ00013]MCO0611863.1 DUF4198 domain-containing protein [Lutimaribacter sp. EGI FJ00015]MCO0635016.1 DUF4198 domain-containing protein [Lutimaribacter sp. EGI FJ00014]